MAKKYSIIKSSDKIRKAIIDRITELKLSQQQIILDASQRGYKLPMDMLSRYINHGDMRGSLREEQIVWLATRYGIYLSLKVGKMIIDEDNRPEYKVTPYDEEEAVSALKKLFPDTK
jgi:hypothetical protein